MRIKNSDAKQQVQHMQHDQAQDDRMIMAMRAALTDSMDPIHSQIRGIDAALRGLDARMEAQNSRTDHVEPLLAVEKDSDDDEELGAAD